MTWSPPAARRPPDPRPAPASPTELRRLLRELLRGAGHKPNCRVAYSDSPPPSLALEELVCSCGWAQTFREALAAAAEPVAHP